MPGNFYTFDFYNIFGISIRRLVSFIAELTTIGQFLVVPLVFLLFKKSLKSTYKNVKVVVISMVILLGLGKGAILICIIAVSYSMKHILGYKKIANLFYIGITVLSIFIIVYSLNNHTSVSIHFNGLMKNIINSPKNILGNGIGSAGNFALLYINDYSNDIGSGESFLGVLIGQLGLVGLILYGTFMLSLIKKLNNIIRKCEVLKEEDIIIKGLLIGVVVASFLSQSAIGFIAI